MHDRKLVKYIILSGSRNCGRNRKICKQRKFELTICPILSREKALYYNFSILEFSLTILRKNYYKLWSPKFIIDYNLIFLYISKTTVNSLFGNKELLWPKLLL